MSEVPPGGGPGGGTATLDLPPASPVGEPPASRIAEPIAEPGTHQVMEPVSEHAPDVLAAVPATAEQPAPAEPAPPARLGDAGLDMLFRTARTTWSWTDEPVGDDTLRELYELLRLGPTSGNASPARFMFLRTPDAKARLRPSLSTGNSAKTQSAPVLCIVAHDPAFFNDLPRLAPGADARDWFAHNEELASATAFRNGTLQGAYLILAARALGLGCGPMSGFDNGAVDREFFSLSGWRSNFLVALGHPDHAVPGPRAPRLSFDEACRLL